MFTSCKQEDEYIKQIKYFFYLILIIDMGIDQSKPEPYQENEYGGMQVDSNQQQHPPNQGSGNNNNQKPLNANAAAISYQQHQQMAASKQKMGPNKQVNSISTLVAEASNRQGGQPPVGTPSYQIQLQNHLNRISQQHNQMDEHRKLQLMAGGEQASATSLAHAYVKLNTHNTQPKNFDSADQGIQGNTKGHQNAVIGTSSQKYYENLAGMNQNAQTPHNPQSATNKLYVQSRTLPTIYSNNESNVAEAQSTVLIKGGIKSANQDSRQRKEDKSAQSTREQQHQQVQNSKPQAQQNFKKRRESQTSKHSAASKTSKLKHASHRELYDQLMSQHHQKSPSMTKNSRAKAEMIQNPGKVLRKPKQPNRTAMNKAVAGTNSQLIMDQSNADLASDLTNSFSIKNKQMTNMQSAKEIMESIEKFKKYRQRQHEKKGPTSNGGSTMAPPKKKKSKQLSQHRQNEFDIPRKPAMESVQNNNGYDYGFVNHSQQRQQQVMSSVPKLQMTQLQQQHQRMQIQSNQYEELKNTLQQLKDNQSQGHGIAINQNSHNVNYALNAFQPLTSPNGFPSSNRQGVKSHLQSNEDFSPSKSDTNLIHQRAVNPENAYLSRKIARQGQADYYQQSSGTLKRPVSTTAGEQAGNSDFYQSKKSVYTNMTSRVLYGHRKQEDLKAQNWSSLMTKSERANVSCKSQISFCDRQNKEEFGLQNNPTGSLITQSATFSKNLNQNLIGAAEHASVQATLGNLKEVDVFFTDGRNGQERRSHNWSDRSGSLRITPQKSINQELEKNAATYFNQKHESVPNNFQSTPELPSNDQQRPSLTRTTNNFDRKLHNQKKKKRQTSITNQVQRAKEQLRKLQEFEGNKSYSKTHNGSSINVEEVSKDHNQEAMLVRSIDGAAGGSMMMQAVGRGMMKGSKEQIREKKKHAKDLISDLNPANLDIVRQQSYQLANRNIQIADYDQQHATKSHSVYQIDSPDMHYSHGMYNSSILQRRTVKFGGGEDLLDGLIAFTLILFDPSSFRKFMCLSPNWNYLVLDGMDQAFKNIECDFINKFYQHLLFKRSYTNSSIIYAFGKRGIRLDRVLVCEVLNNSQHINKCLGAHFAYKLHLEKTQPLVIGPGKAMVRREHRMSIANQEHMATYKFDIVNESQKRLVWIHRDQSEEAQDDGYESSYRLATNEIDRIKQRPLTQPIIQVCQGDIVEIAVNFFSMQGMLNLSSVEWFIPQLTEPTKENVLNYDKDRHQQNPDRIMKIHCDLGRICEVEDSVVEWYEADYFQGRFAKLNLDHLSSHFKIISYQCAGVDGLICKIHLIAQRPGRFDDPILGIPILIKQCSLHRFDRRTSCAISASYDDDQGVLVHEIKRVGFLIDRYVDLQLRVNDSLVVYLQRASA